MVHVIIFVSVVSFRIVHVIIFVSVAKSDIMVTEALQLNFAAIEAATDKFSENNKLGAGGFGEVYKVETKF